MNTWLQGFLDNDSFFGKLMTKIGIIIAANIMFILFSVPFVTIGAGLTALYHVMFKTLRGGGICNPFKEFWAGFKSNFKQATVTWVIFVFLTGFPTVDLQICEQAGGALSKLRIPIYVIGAAIIFLYLYMLPTTAAFYGSIAQHVKDSLYFIIRKPLRFIVIAFFDIFPLFLTYTDRQYLPLYGFIWAVCGFGLITMLGATLLLPVFKPFLDDIDEDGDDGQNPYGDEYASMDDLRELDGF